MVSEFLPGKEYAFQSIRENGEIVMSQARERIEYLYGFLSPSGQSSTPSIAKTVHNEEINELVSKVVKLIDPNATGIFCADLKTDKD
jgi:carbamoyl-phosphate synthase large subunit